MHLKFFAWLLMALSTIPMALADTQHYKTRNFLGFIPFDGTVILLHQNL